MAALLLSLTGGAFAAGTALPRNSVGSAQVVDRSLLAKDFKRGQLPAGADGLPGEPGAPGAPGPAGPRGGFDPAKISYASSGTSFVSAGGVATVHAECPGGTRVIAGGGSTGSGYLFASVPSGNGWTAGITASSFSGGNASAWAVCVAP